MPRRPGETLEEYRQRLSTSGAFTDGHLDRLTSIAGRAAYAPAGSAGADRPGGLRGRRHGPARSRERDDVGQRIAGHYRLRR